MRRHEAEVPWGSFADALSGALFVFVLTTFLFAYQLTLATQQANAKLDILTGADELANDLTRETGVLTTCLGEGGVLEPVPDPGEARVALYLPGVEWFDSGKALLDTPQREDAAARIRTCVASLIASPDLDGRYRVHVSLEGHTDSQRYRAGEDETNWELSGRRAAAVVRRVLDGTEPSILRAVDDERLQVTSTGFADRQPAWARVCKEQNLAPEDRAVCEALATSDPSVAYHVLENPALYARDETCTARTPEVARWSRSERIRRWANRCPDPIEDPGRERRGLLRRVDLSLELVPLVAEDNAPTLPLGPPMLGTMGVR